MACMWKCSNFTGKWLQKSEQLFYKLGVVVATHPWKTILFSWIFVIVSVFGFFRFHHEKNPIKLWVPPDSDFFHDTVWLMAKYKTVVRPQTMMITAPNVLTPFVLEQVALITEQVRNTRSKNNVAWRDVCFSIPLIELPRNSKDKKSGNDTYFDPSIDLDPNLYCAIMENFRQGCLEVNLLDLWKANKDALHHLTRQDILDKINTATISPIFGDLTNYTRLLGNIKRNSTGHIIAAESLMTFWMVNVDFDKVDMNTVGNDAGTADWASEQVLDWEEAFLDTMRNVSNYVVGLNLYYEASRSFGDITGTAMFQDMDKLAIGIAMMVIYVQMIISNFNCLEMRLTLGSMGLLSVGMAFISACGISSLLGISYGPVHTSLPFLLMGLGVDDMFVMMATWNQQMTKTEKNTLPERIGFMLQHAGMSITVTSLTDVLAFIIGASTILPSLQSFCLYAAIGVFLTFVFAMTFFTACFTLDQKRVQKNLNGILICYRHKEYEFPECSRRSYSSRIFRTIYSKIILTIPGQVFVLLIVLVSTAVSFESALKLEQRFDPRWFIPDNTYLTSYIAQRNHYYPLMGYEGAIFMGGINYSYEIGNINNLVEEFKARSDIVNDIDPWTEHFVVYIQKVNPTFRLSNMTDEQWRVYISKFLFSPTGAKYQANFRFSEKLRCGEPAPDVTVSSINFRFNHFSGPEETLPAMHVAQDIVGDRFSTGDKFATVWAKIFGTWVTDEVIHVEVMRNLMLTLICVMFCTIIMITDIQMCIWIFICVLLTMINVCGYMQRWGLTIDLVACIALELAIGLCIDYATHIGHTFLSMVDGSRKDRAVATVSHIGAAVLYGGGSTLLALSMLSQSEAYVFKSFFKIFLLVVTFGLFHGVVFLPVVLSIIGPKPYSHVHKHAPVPQAEEEPVDLDNLEEKEVSII